jgi:beta-lactamase superfamily II metal-dependent hydrolase
MFRRWVAVLGKYGNDRLLVVKDFSAKASYLFRILPHYLLPVLTFLSLSALALLIGQRLRHREPPPLPSDRLIVTVLNVGQGESSWIRTPGGHFVVIGGGPPGQGTVLMQSLKNAKAHQIDLLIIPYPYAEVLGGLPETINRFPIIQSWEPGGQAINQWHTQVRTLLAQGKVSMVEARVGKRFVLDGVQFEVLAPADPLLTESPVAANNSMVVRVTYGKTRLLWSGGLERRGETALLSRQTDISANWLRVARFGTRNATSPEFLRQVAPEIAVVSVGPNRSGHPHPDTLSRLAATGALVYRTDTQAGPLQFFSDGESITGPN